VNELKRLRLNRGLSVEELAAETGVAASTIWNIERGDTIGPRLVTLKPLADFLEVPAGDLAAALVAPTEAAA
jgi:transcriptional regulator with XRE-family HTH domain